MIIIGEKINGARKQVGAAIAARDDAFIRDLALKQAAAGVQYLDVSAGTSSGDETAALVWLIDTIQAATDVPLCLDSPDPNILAAAVERTKQPPMLNSISGEKKRLEGILPLVSRGSGPVIMLAMDDKGIPKTTTERMAVIRHLIGDTRRSGVNDERIFVDPLVMAVATGTDSGRIALETMKAIHAEFPAAHIVSGLSNVSFGLPVRSLVNRAFLTLAIDAGLDSSILDPLDKSLRSAILAAELVLGYDKHCLNYTRSFRAGKLQE